MRNKIVPAVLVCAILFSCACIATASNNDEKLKANPVVKVIWGSDSASAYSMANFLNNHGGVDAEALPAGKAPVYDFSTTDQIIICYCTELNWTDMAQVYAIKHANKPVFAIGQGGCKYLLKAGMGTGDFGVTYSSKQNSKVVDPTSPLFNDPTPITIPGNNTLTVHKTKVSTKFLYVPSLPGNVTALMLDPADNNYATMTYEANYTFFWGFDTTDPYVLASHGSSLFLNGLHYSRTYFKSHVPEFGLVIPTILAFVMVACFCVFRSRKD